MQLSDLATGMGGNVRVLKVSLTYADFNTLSTSSGTAKNLTISKANGVALSLLAGSKIIGVALNPTVAFSGGSISALTLSMARNGGTPAELMAAQTIAATTYYEASVFKSIAHADFGLMVTVTPTSDALSALTAGAVDLYIYILGVSTPSA